MTKLAILSDIHGNSVALQAVLDDLDARGGAEHLIVLGDLAVFGPDPVGVLSLLQARDPIFYVCGNTDRYLFEAQYPSVPTTQDWKSQVLASFVWTAEQLGETDLTFLESLPSRQLLSFGEGYAIMAVHGSPRSDEENIEPETPDAELSSMLGGQPYDLLLCGHTHVPLDRVVAGRRVVNPGSVGLPFDGIPRAGYALLRLRPGADYGIEFHRVAYDIEAVVGQLAAVDHPAASVQAYNLRTAQRLSQDLIYPDQMRQGPTLAGTGDSTASKNRIRVTVANRLPQSLERTQ